MILLTLLLFAQDPSGATIFENNCAACHAGTDPRVPSVAALQQRTPESIVDALTVGRRSLRVAQEREWQAEDGEELGLLGRALRPDRGPPLYEYSRSV